MKRLHMSLFCALSIAAVAVGCGSDPVGKKPAASAGCDEDQVGMACDCDGDDVGTIECDSESDELVCTCRRPTKTDSTKPTTSTGKDPSAKDAGVAKVDAGKTTTPKVDSGAPSTTLDAGDDTGPSDPVPGDKPDPSKLPKVMGTCPDLKDGTITIGGAKVQLNVGSNPGPVYLYFHGTGTSPGEINQAIGGATSAVKTEGGMAASWDTSNNMGSSTGTIWYTGDLDAADQLIACGIEKGLVDTARIHVSGYSAGGLETGAFVVGRSHYVASVIVYSGGKPFGVPGAIGAGGHVPSMVGAHGKDGSDSLGINFGAATPALGQEIAKAGGFAMDCDDGSSHIDTLSRFAIGGKAREFFKAHPWGVKPWTAVPAGWPSNCKVFTK